MALPLAGASRARAADPVKIGLLLPFSGPFADFGQQIGNGIELWRRQHGTTVAGREIVLLKRDANGVDPAQTRRFVQELVTREKVDFLAGFGLTPDAMAAAPIGTEARVPMVVMNAATGYITERSPYFVRVSFTLAQLVAPLGQWAPGNGIRRVFVAVSDYAPGHEAADAFTRAFVAAGGEVIGETRIPLQNLEFAAYVQRIADARPDGVFLFLPSGQLPLNFMRQFVQFGLAASGIRLLGATEIIDDTVIATLGEAVIGALSVQNYSYAHPGARNRDFVAAYAAAFGPHPRPNFMSVAGYDGMAAIHAVIDRLGGTIDGDRAIEAFKGLTLDSPRGPIEIDAESRDLIESVYIRRVERVDGDIVNREILEFPRVRAPH
jgi:branched-chain amino acid transport system substrate-binding protein